MTRWLLILTLLLSPVLLARAGSAMCSVAGASVALTGSACHEVSQALCCCDELSTAAGGCPCVGAPQSPPEPVTTLPAAPCSTLLPHLALMGAAPAQFAPTLGERLEPHLTLSRSNARRARAMLCIWLT